MEQYVVKKRAKKLLITSNNIENKNPYTNKTSTYKSTKKIIFIAKKFYISS